MIGHDKHDPELPDTTCEDHAYDATAYGCMSRPFSPTRPKPQEIRDAWADDKIKRSAWTY